MILISNVFGEICFCFFLHQFFTFLGRLGFFPHRFSHLRYTLYILNWRVKDDRKIYTYRQDGTILTIQAVFVLFRVGDIQMQNNGLMNSYVCVMVYELAAEVNSAFLLTASFGSWS